MKKRNKAMLLLLLLLVVLTSCGYKDTGTKELPVVKNPLTRSESLLHTVVQLSIYHEGQEAVMDEAIALIQGLERLLSTNLAESDIYKINAAAGKNPVKVEKKTYQLIETALDFSKESEGRFDISIGAVNKLWKIGSEDARKPDDNEIKAALPYVDYRKVKLDSDEQTVFIEEGMSLEMGAISKGYIADQVRALFNERGITTAIINLGGNVVVMGTSPHNAQGWNVGVQDPDQTRGATVGSVYQSNRSIVTSGIYERYLEVDGQIYHHILDPKTGYPVENTISGVTIFTDTSTQGDGLSTTLFIYGIKDGLAYVNQLDGVEAVFIDKNHGVYLSDGLKDTFTLTNKEYHIEN